VRVSGTRFLPSDPYTVKLEGVKRAGFRTISIAGIRDPILIRQIDSVLAEIRRQTEKDSGRPGIFFFMFTAKTVSWVQWNRKKTGCRMSWGLSSKRLPRTRNKPLPFAPVRAARSSSFRLSRADIPAGNLALLYSPSDIPCGEVYTFNIYSADDRRLIRLRVFPITVYEVNR
jgi:hypothetical protein